MKALSLTAIGVMALCGAANAGQTVYDCQLKNNQKRYGWIPERMVVFVDDQAGKAMVIDDYINHFHEKPIPASYEKLGGDRFRVKWVMDKMKVRANGDIRANFQASISEKTGRAQMRVRIAGAADNRPSGQGPCKITKQK
ncbi:MAG: hypothetical protein AB3N15_10685 [Paracoccaceae bacterium]